MRHFSGFFAAALVIAAVSPIAPASAGGKANPGVTSCKLVRTAANLQAINNKLSANYCLANDIDASSIANFVPLGDVGTPFAGKFFGNGHVISNLTINSGHAGVGLFGAIDNGTVQDVGLLNANILGSGAGAQVGGIVGVAQATLSNVNTVSNVYVTGQTKCTNSACNVAGLIGQLAGKTTLSDSWTSAKVTAVDNIGGGAVATLDPNGVILRTYATGSVSVGNAGVAGGIVGSMQGTVSDSFSTAAIVCGAGSATCGGLVGFQDSGSVLRSFSLGSVTTGDNTNNGGLIGYVNNGSVDQTFAAGLLTAGIGANVGGLIGFINGSPTVGGSYWDSDTTNRAITAGGQGTFQTHAQIQASLPANLLAQFWSINKTLSYPFLNSPGFTPSLSTLVLSNTLFTFLPISQLDKSNYGGSPKHTDQASLATVYTIIARAIGLADNVSQLKNVKTTKYFWKDSTQTTTFTGPVTAHATLGTLKNLGKNAKMTTGNVIGQMNLQRLVVLRGSFTPDGGGTATHYMLGTLYTKNPDDTVSLVVALDPWTGQMVSIDPVSKQVVEPSDFPLSDFKVNGYQPVTIN